MIARIQTVPQVLRKLLNEWAAMRIVGTLAAVVMLSGCDNPTSTQIGGKTFNFKSFADNLESNIARQEVGYAFVVSYQDEWIDMRSGGYARSEADMPQLTMSPFVAFSIASVAKTITAAAALKVLYENDSSGGLLFQPIGPYLPPDFDADSNFQGITFAQLLSHTSGIGNGMPNSCLQNLFNSGVIPDAADPGNHVDYATLQSYVACHPDVSVTTPLYENTNFALFRFLIPNLLLARSNLPPPPPSAESPQLYANLFINYVQQNIFDLSELYSIPTTTNPPATGLLYHWPNLASGVDMGDLTLSIGSEGWVMSPVQLAKFFRGLNFGGDKKLATFVRSFMQNIPNEWQKNPPGCMGYDPTPPNSPNVSCGAWTTWSDPNNTNLKYYYWTKDGNYPGCLYNATPPRASGGEFRSKLVLFSNDVSVVLFVNSNLDYQSANPNFAPQWPNNTDPCGFKNNDPLWAILDAFNATLSMP